MYSENSEMINVKMHFLDKFEIFWYFSTYQSLRRLPLLKIANSQYFPLAPFARFIMKPELKFTH